MDELIKRLTDELEDELEGIIDYSKTYDMLKNVGDHYDADRIEDIASQEYYHAKTLWEIISNMGVDLSHNTKIQNDWARVKELFAIE